MLDPKILEKNLNYLTDIYMDTLNSPNAHTPTVQESLKQTHDSAARQLVKGGVTKSLKVARRLFAISLNFHPGLPKELDNPIVKQINKVDETGWPIGFQIQIFTDTIKNWACIEIHNEDATESAFFTEDEDDNLIAPDPKEWDEDDFPLPPLLDKLLKEHHVRYKKIHSVSGYTHERYLLRRIELSLKDLGKVFNL